MKPHSTYKRILILGLFTVIGMGPILTSCGSDTGPTAGIGGTGITQGEITAFGSIFVNGIEFETDDSQFEVDGNSTANQSNLSIGMVVTIKGKINSDGLTGTADSVDYDDEVQGPVAAITGPVDGQRTISIFNKSVTIDETSTSYKDTNFADIAQNDIVEISGFSTSATGITATFVKKTGTFPADTEIELRGTISELSTSNFKLAGITIDTDNDTEIDVPGGNLSDGLFVEVHGDLQSSLTSVLAREIEFEDDDFEDGSELSLQGVISDFNSIADFEVGSQTVDASTATLSPASAILQDGVQIEVEGEIVGGVLIAEEIELQEGSVELKAAVSAVDMTNNQMQFQFPPTSGSILVTIDNQTQFEDEFSDVQNFSLADISPADFIQVEGFENGSGVIASEVKRLDPGDEDTQIQGSVSAYSQSTSITILGLTFMFDGNEDYEPGGLDSSITTGDIIELVDENNPADGIIDKIKSD